MKNSNQNFNTLDNLMDMFLNNNFVKSMNDEPICNTKNSNNMIPPVNIKENESGFNIEVIVPGLSKEEVKLSVKENILTISYDKSETAEAENEKVLRNEFGNRSFSRSFTLGKRVNAEGIQAKLENGILYITLPKKEEPKPVEVDIAIS